MRRKMKKKNSKKVFQKNSGVHPRNKTKIRRGGYRI